MNFLLFFILFDYINTQTCQYSPIGSSQPTVGCDNNCNTCTIDCSQGDSCKQYITVYSGALNTIITCGSSSCEGSFFYIGNVGNIAESDPDTSLTVNNLYRNNYESVTINCNGNDACISTTFHIVGSFKNVTFWTSTQTSNHLSGANIYISLAKPNQLFILRCATIDACSNSIVKCSGNAGNCICTGGSTNCNQINGGSGIMYISWSPTTQSMMPTNIPTKKVITNYPSVIPTKIPTKIPTNIPTSMNPTIFPTKNPTFFPTKNPSNIPTKLPSNIPSLYPTTLTLVPTLFTINPTNIPSVLPTKIPTNIPTNIPTLITNQPTVIPTKIPTNIPTVFPTTNIPSLVPSNIPTIIPTKLPSLNPTSMNPTLIPTNIPTNLPSYTPTNIPTNIPTKLLPVTNNDTNTTTNIPTINPTQIPTYIPTKLPTYMPTYIPTKIPTNNPTHTPTTNAPTLEPTIFKISTTQQPTKSPTQKKKVYNFRSLFNDLVIIIIIIIVSICCLVFWIILIIVIYKQKKLKNEINQNYRNSRGSSSNGSSNNMGINNINIKNNGGVIYIDDNNKGVHVLANIDEESSINELYENNNTTEGNITDDQQGNDNHNKKYVNNGVITANGDITPIETDEDIGFNNITEGVGDNHQRNNKDDVIKGILNAASKTIGYK